MVKPGLILSYKPWSPKTHQNTNTNTKHKTQQNIQNPSVTLKVKLKFEGERFFKYKKQRIVHIINVSSIKAVMILYFLFLINIGGFQVSLKFRPCPLSLALQYLYQSFTSKVAQKSVLSLPRLWPKLADSMCICIIKAIEISLPGGDQKHSFIKQQQTVFYLIQGNMGKTLFTRHILLIIL